MDYGVVSIEHLGRVRYRAERRVVPVSVVLETRRHLGFGHVDDVGVLVHVQWRCGHVADREEEKSECGNNVDHLLHFVWIFEWRMMFR